MRLIDGLFSFSLAFSCSFEIIQVPFKQNKSPIQYVEHHLGIESWCIKFVYQYAHRLIISQRKQSRIPPTIVKYLNCVILINPDVSTFWNLRRMLVERVQLNITQEFQFSSLVLTKKPKSSEAFFYRRWLYSFQSKFLRHWRTLLIFIQNSQYYESSFLIPLPISVENESKLWNFKNQQMSALRKKTHIIQFHFRWRGDWLGCWNFADWTMRRKKGRQLSRMESSSVGAAKGAQLATLWAGEDWKVHQEKYRRLQLLPSPTLCLDELVRAAILWHLQSWMHWRFDETTGIILAQAWHQS